MKTASIKHALYINRLSYILYKLDGCVNKRTIVFPDEAQQLPLDVAEDMINELKNKIYNREMELYVYPYIHGMDKLVSVNKVSSPCYMKVDKITPVNNSLIVNMNNGTHIEIVGSKSIIIGTSEVSLKGAYNELVKAINHDLDVMIYEGKTTIVISIKETSEDTLIISLIETLNSILEIMGYKMPISWDNKFSPANIQGIKYFLEKRDNDIAEKFNEILKSDSTAKAFCNLLKVQTSL